MIRKILAGLGLILVIFIIIAALKPEDYVIKRDITIHAPPEAIFPYLENAKKGDSWAPWREIDTQMKMNYSGPEKGVGSTSHWESEGQMGTGKAEIVSVIPNKSVKIAISYSKPMEMHQDSEFILSPKGEATQMTWVVSGKQPFIGRLMCTLMFMNMDSYVGGMFEKGLGKLKSVVEGP